MKWTLLGTSLHCRHSHRQQAAKNNGTTNGKAEPMTVSVYPNPSVADYKLRVITAYKEVIHVRILDLLGRELEHTTIQPYQTIGIGNYLKAGGFMLEVRQGGVVRVMKLVKF
ncbi:MAG: T9SS type A sorting domain-containing protein [Ferruginibacter sp.]